MVDGKPHQLYCHVCGEFLQQGGLGFSGFEYSCPICLAAYHVEAGLATYVTPSFIGHGESPAVIPVAQLQAPDAVQHTSGP